jgi:ABC-2 type transport system ATP-binding protein
MKITGTIAAGLVAAALALMACLGTPTVATAAAGPAEPSPPAVPHPFGKLSCAPEYGIRLCSGGLRGGRDLRIPSFDGVPLDADVALPATGKGPFPLLVLLHGLGESKAEYEVTSNDGGIDDVTMADHGYAVLMYTSRGFGTSCGTATSRVDTPGCARGWIQLADQRYEVRDTQYLAGLLVDEGLVKPDIAVAGLSYGGGQSLELAMLKNRMRLPGGKFVPFTSPVHHVPMTVAAAYAMWPWDDLATSLVPNGHLSTTANTPAVADVSPAGVAKQSWLSLLYGVTEGGYLAPKGADPQSAITTWDHEVLAGEPYTTKETDSLRVIQEYKSAIGIPMPPGGPAPTAIQSGWTDTLFPVSEALHYADRITAAHEPTPLLLMFDDVGHGWAQNKPADLSATDSRGIEFLDSVMLTHTKPSTGVVAIAQTCPSSAPSGPAVTGPSLPALAPGHVDVTGAAAETVTSGGGDPTVAADLDAAYSAPLCDPMPAAAEPGTAVYEQAVGNRAVELLGAPTVRAHVTVTGDEPELVARLWDVSPDGTRQIVALGVYRPAVNQAPGTSPTARASRTVRFQLDPNEYTFAPGHRIELELVGSTAPLFRKSNGTFSIVVTHLTARLPTR